MTALHQSSNPGPAETPGSNDRRVGAPNHHPPAASGTGDVTHAPAAPDASAAAGRDASGVPLGLPDRAVRAAVWTGWHLFEITGVAGSAVVAVSVTPWAWLLAALTAIGWTTREVRTTRRARDRREPARLLPDGTARGTARREVD